MNNLFSDLATCPRMFPDEIDFSERMVSFCEMNRETYYLSSFLDDRKLRIDSNNYKLRLDFLLNKLGSCNNAPDAINWIFHTPHSGSTLIARALNEIDNCFVLKEPTLLIQASSLRRHPEFPRLRQSGDWQRFFTMVQNLLSRTFTDTDVTLIKTTSVCHNLIPDIFEGNRPARGLFLYSSLENFLVSLYKRGYIDAYLNAGFKGALHDLHHLDILDPDEADTLPDHRKAALLWLPTVLNINIYTEENPGRKIQTLDCRQFFAERETSLAAITDHLGYRCDTSSIQAIVRGNIFARDAKSDRGIWSESEHQNKNTLARRKFDKEIDDALSWTETLTRDKGFTFSIPFT